MSAIRTLTRLLAAATLIASLSSCGGGPGASEGQALEADNDGAMLIDAVPGDQWSVQIAVMVNTSQDVLTLNDIQLRGPDGQLPSNVDIIETRVAPVPGGDPAGIERYDWTPGGLFKTFPPAMVLMDRERCNVQRAEGVEGFHLQPGADAYILLWMEALSPGKANYETHEVYYEVDGEQFHQTLDTGVEVTVTRNGKSVHGRIDPTCLSKVERLPSGR